MENMLAHKAVAKAIAKVNCINAGRDIEFKAASAVLEAIANEIKASESVIQVVSVEGPVRWPLKADIQGGTTLNVYISMSELYVAVKAHAPTVFSVGTGERFSASSKEAVRVILEKVFEELYWQTLKPGCPYKLHVEPLTGASL